MPRRATCEDAHYWRLPSEGVGDATGFKPQQRGAWHAVDPPPAPRWQQPQQPPVAEPTPQYPSFSDAIRAAATTGRLAAPQTYRPTPQQQWYAQTQQQPPLWSLGDPLAAPDPNAPKGKSSAFIFFGSATRAEIKAAHPDWSLGDVGRELGKRWKELTEDDKKPYHDLAAKDAERYKTEMEAYKAKQAADEE